MGSGCGSHGTERLGQQQVLLGVAADPVPGRAGQGNGDKELGTGGTFDHSTLTGKVHPQKSAQATCRGGFAWHTDPVLSHQASTQLNFNINRD